MEAAEHLADGGVLELLGLVQKLVGDRPAHQDFGAEVGEVVAVVFENVVLGGGEVLLAFAEHLHEIRRAHFGFAHRHFVHGRPVDRAPGVFVADSPRKEEFLAFG